MVQNGLIFLFLLFPLGLSETVQRPLRHLPSRELVRRLCMDDWAQEARHEIRQRMNEVAIKGINEDRELVQALIETLDSGDVDVMEEAVLNLFIVQDQAVRKRLLHLLRPGNDAAVQGAVLAGISHGQGIWPVDERDIENIKSIILRPIQSIDERVKGPAILALGTLGAVTVLEDLKKYEWIRSNYSASLEAALKRAHETKKRNLRQ